MMSFGHCLKNLLMKGIAMWTKSETGDTWEFTIEDLENLIRWYSPRKYKDETSTAESFDIKIMLPGASQILLNDKFITFQKRENDKEKS